MTPKIGLRLTDAETEKVAVIAAYIDASPHEWPKGLADIALLCHGYLDLQQRIAQLESELAEARQGNEELDGTDAAHPAWWRGNDAGVAQVCAQINAILDGADVFGTASEPWESTRRRVAEARKNLERLREAAK